MTVIYEGMPMPMDLDPETTPSFQVFTIGPFG